MKFFLPHATGDEQAESVYRLICEHAASTTGWKMSDRRVFRLRFVHDGKSYEAEVGKVTSFNGEEVIAILDSVTYLVCTPNRGVAHDGAILVGKNYARDVVFFDRIETDQASQEET